MAARVGWSQRALRDVEAIAEYIAEDSPVYAAVVVRNIIAQTKMLSQFPRCGRKVPEFGVLKSLRRKHHIRDTHCIHKSTRIALIGNARIEKRGHGHIVSGRRIILTLDDWPTVWASRISRQSPPISRMACMFDGVEPDPIVRVIGTIRTVRIDRHPSAINQRLHPR